jgi:RNA polymerase sigma-70 factor, ECF subfamily
LYRPISIDFVNISSSKIGLPLGTEQLYFPIDFSHVPARVVRIETSLRAPVSAEAPERLLYFPVVARERVDAKSKETGSDEPAGTSDEALLTRTQARDADAVGILFDRYSRLILGIGFRILHDRGEAEDLVQEFFLRLWQRASSFDASKGSARTWMVQCAYRRAFDQRAYLTRRRFYNGTDLAAAKNALQEGMGLEDEIAAHVTGGQLRAAFDELSDKQRATLELYFFEGCNLREVAQQIGETVENTRHHYYRGLEQLRRAAIALGLRGEK